MKKWIYSVTLLLLSNSLYCNWDSPKLITNQNSTSIKIQQKLGDLLAVGLNIIALGKAINEDGNEGIKQYAYATTTNTILTLGLKYGVNRTRPDGDDYSFPSGHTSYSFMAATFLQERYGSKWGVPALVGASFVGYSRVASKRHYISDVLAGGVIGALSSLYFTTPYVMNMGEHTYNIYAQPYGGTKSLGLQMHIYFK